MATPLKILPRLDLIPVLAYAFYQCESHTPLKTGPYLGVHQARPDKTIPVLFNAETCTFSNVFGSAFGAGEIIAWTELPTPPHF
jgi:hypothetical protein